MKLLKFGADWCNTCKAQEKELEKLTDVEFESIDVDDDKNDELAVKYKVASLPVIIIETDSEIRRFNGLTKAEVIQTAINELKEK